MNPYGITGTPRFDLRAIDAWNQLNERARDENRGERPGTCGHCTPGTTCQHCRRRARLDLRVATSQEECADLLEVIDRPSPRAARCGTIGGYQAHRRHSEEPCDQCRNSHNAYQRSMRASR